MANANEQEASADHRVVLHAKDRECTRRCCTAPGYLSEVHHVDEWAAHHRTDIDILIFACGPDHKPLEQGWITRENVEGITEWIPPPQFDFGKPTTNGYFHPERCFRVNN